MATFPIRESRADRRRLGIETFVHDLLFPSTDRAVAVQAVIAFSILSVLIALPHRYRETRLFVIGVAVLLAGLFGLRALH
ncbi:MAG: hypothetical protein AB7V43_01210 [Acidimicrobiia bacterium]